ncbi:MAG: hypothetical protein N2690_04125 [Rhodocyclaceae bacterium]|nr:hypothetical protein [Rhodocyclaceae bacterium]
MDEADLTAERIEHEMAALLRQRRQAGPAATGTCLWCDAGLTGGRRWCDADCRDDWEKTYEKMDR